MKKIIGLLLSLTIIAIMAYCVRYPYSLALDVVVTIVWTFIQVGTVYTVIGLGLLHCAEGLTEISRKETLTELRTLFCERSKYSVGAFHTGCAAIVIVIGLVLTGCLLTALCFLLIVAMMKYTRYTISQSAGKWTAC